MTLLLHYRLVSSGDLSLLFLTLLTVVTWQHLELGKRNGFIPFFGAFSAGTCLVHCDPSLGS